MKKLLVLALVALCAVALDAAQCEGLTKEGVRCKREAAENSKYCIGHADQAKAPKAEKLKDDGTCWAVTEKGTRCKHKKDGAGDYCKQHAADKKPAQAQKRCRALKWDGQQCERAPQPDCYYCKQHAKLGAAAAAKPATQDESAKKEKAKTTKNSEGTTAKEVKK